jgi:hypothetical protein
MKPTRFGIKSIRSMGCRCVADAVCYNCSSVTPYGVRYKTTWNEAVRIHNEEVKREPFRAKARRTAKQR